LLPPELSLLLPWLSKLQPQELLLAWLAPTSGAFGQVSQMAAALGSLRLKLSDLESSPVHLSFAPDHDLVADSIP